MYERCKDGTLPQQPVVLPGSLKVELEHSHKKQLCYFISHLAIHSVTAEKDEFGKSLPFASLYVKGSKPNCKPPVRVYSNTPFTPEDREQENHTPDADIEDEGTRHEVAQRLLELVQ